MCHNVGFVHWNTDGEFYLQLERGKMFLWSHLFTKNLVRVIANKTNHTYEVK